VYFFTHTRRGVSSVSSKMTIVAATISTEKVLLPPQNPGICIDDNGGPTRTLENSAAQFSRLGCADDAIANFPPALDAGPRRRLRRGPELDHRSQQRIDAALLLLVLRTMPSRSAIELLFFSPGIVWACASGRHAVGLDIRLLSAPRVGC